MMNHIVNYSSFKINEERLGLAESTLFYVPILTMRCMSEIHDFVSRTIDINVDKKDYKEQKEVLFSYRDFKGFITNWEKYKDFPVVEIKLNISLNKLTPKKMTDIYGVENPIKVGGAASPFATGREKQAARIKDPIKLSTRHGISIYMDIEFDYGRLFNMDEHEQRVEIAIESTIYHELNHLYEFYKRKIGKQSPINVALTWSSIGDNTRRRPKKIFDFWQHLFTELIYLSEPYEIRAATQEVKSYVNRFTLEEFKEKKPWKIAKKMQNFRYKEMLDKFDKIVAEHNPEYVGAITERLVKDFKKEYKNQCSEYKTKCPINPDFIDRLSTDEFFEFFEKRIRKAGEKLIRNFTRLYVFKKEKESI